MVLLFIGVISIIIIIEARPPFIIMATCSVGAMHTCPRMVLLQIENLARHEDEEKEEQGRKGNEE